MPPVSRLGKSHKYFMLPPLRTKFVQGVRKNVGGSKRTHLSGAVAMKNGGAIQISSPKKVESFMNKFLVVVFASMFMFMLASCGEDEKGGCCDSHSMPSSMDPN